MLAVCSRETEAPEPSGVFGMASTTSKTSFNASATDDATATPRML